MAQIDANGLAYIIEERKAIALTIFPLDIDVSILPINVVKGQAADFYGSQSQTDEKQKNRQISLPFRSLSVTLLNQQRDFFWF